MLGGKLAPSNQKFCVCPWLQWVMGGNSKFLGGGVLGNIPIHNRACNSYIILPQYSYSCHPSYRYTFHIDFWYPPPAHTLRFYPRFLTCII